MGLLSKNRHWANVVLILCKRMGRWLNIKTALFVVYFVEPQSVSDVAPASNFCFGPTYRDMQYLVISKFLGYINTAIVNLSFVCWPVSVKITAYTGGGGGGLLATRYCHWSWSGCLPLLQTHEPIAGVPRQHLRDVNTGSWLFIRLPGCHGDPPSVQCYGHLTPPADLPSPPANRRHSPNVGFRPNINPALVEHIVFAGFVTGIQPLC